MFRPIRGIAGKGLKPLETVHFLKYTLLKKRSWLSCYLSITWKVALLFNSPPDVAPFNFSKNLVGFGTSPYRRSVKDTKIFAGP